jgi:NDP-sugar pyrophosphorylase family protein
MVAVILAGGKGTRLRPFTITIPKPLLPLGDVSILEVVIRQLTAVGIDRVVLTLGHMAHLFTASVGNGSRLGVKVDYCYEERPLGTAGALRLVPDLGEDFLVMNGDVLTTLDYGRLIAHHRNNRAWGTIAITPREIKVGFGVVDSKHDGRLREYREKPVIRYRVSMGINVLSSKAVSLIPRGKKFDMPDLMLALRDHRKKVRSEEHTSELQSP